MPILNMLSTNILSGNRKYWYDVSAVPDAVGHGSFAVGWDGIKAAHE